MMWDLMRELPALGAWSLSYWTTREVRRRTAEKDTIRSINFSGGGKLKTNNSVSNMVSLRSLLDNPNGDTSEKLHKWSRAQRGRMV